MTETLLARFLDAMQGIRVVSGGAAAGIRLASRDADRRFGLGVYEAPVQAAIIDNLQPGDVFYDIGANLGFFSMLAARAAGPEGRVYAFEPSPNNAALIRRGLKLNGITNLTVIEKAVSSTTGRDGLLLAKHIGGATLERVGPPPDMRGRIIVDTVTIDDAIRIDGLQPPALVKIDVEGAEVAVFLGMAATLECHRPKLIYEVDDETRTGLKRKAAAIEAMLFAEGYACTVLPPSYTTGNWHVEHTLAVPR